MKILDILIVFKILIIVNKFIHFFHIMNTNEFLLNKLRIKYI
jgi:hypothetical protein